MKIGGLSLMKESLYELKVDESPKFWNFQLKFYFFTYMCYMYF